MTMLGYCPCLQDLILINPEYHLHTKGLLWDTGEHTCKIVLYWAENTSENLFVRLLIHSYFYGYFYVQCLLVFYGNTTYIVTILLQNLTNITSDVLRTKSKPQDFRLPHRIKTVPSKDEPNLYKGQVRS